MARILLVRHAPAEDLIPGQDDDDRELTEVGRRRLAAVARGLAAIGVQPNVILTSPLVRARQTAEVLAAELTGDEPRILAELSPGHLPEDVLRGLTPWGRAAEILCVGHQPLLEELLSYLLTGNQGLLAVAFRKSAVAAIEVARIPPRESGTLLWFLTPKQSRRLGRH